MLLNLGCHTSWVKDHGRSETLHGIPLDLGSLVDQTFIRHYVTRQPTKLKIIRIGKTSLPHQIMAVVLPVHITTEETSTDSGTAGPAMGIPPAEEANDLAETLPKSCEPTSTGKKELTLLTKKESTSPIKKGSNSPAKRDFVSPMEVTVTLNTDADDHNEQKNLEVPVRKSPPNYGPNNSARRANRRKGEHVEPAPRPSSPLLTPDSRSPASSRPASPFSPSPAARRHSHVGHEELAVPAKRAVSQRRPSAPVVSAPSPTPQFTHPQLVTHPLRNSRSMKDTREGARSEEHDECILAILSIYWLKIQTESSNLSTKNSLS